MGDLLSVRQVEQYLTQRDEHSRLSPLHCIRKHLSGAVIHVAEVHTALSKYASDPAVAQLCKRLRAVVHTIRLLKYMVYDAIRNKSLDVEQFAFLCADARRELMAIEEQIVTLSPDVVPLAVQNSAAEELSLGYGDLYHAEAKHAPELFSSAREGSKSGNHSSGSTTPKK